MIILGAKLAKDSDNWYFLETELNPGKRYLMAVSQSPESGKGTQMGPSEFYFGRTLFNIEAGRSELEVGIYLVAGNVREYFMGYLGLREA